MQLSIRLFANLREQFGTNALSIDVQDNIHANELIHTLVTQHPEAEHALINVMVARNQVLMAPDDVIRATDDVALIPPVGGGEFESDDVSFRLTGEPIRVDEAYAALEDVNHGGTVLFIGTVREWTGNRQTDHLTYEAYETMAKQQMHKIQAQVEAEHPGTTTLQWHRVGRLEPKDIAVICGASSPHRESAFTAARSLIERLKKEVTIWKKEIYADGASVWQANAESSKRESQ